jgi:signal transduction histidine kinase
VTTKKSGVGLGLSIVSKIIDGHHGSIRVENAAEGGAVFTIFFPLEESGGEPANADPGLVWTSGNARTHTS